MPRRARATARPHGRPSAPIRLLPARLVDLAPEHERAALVALAALLAHDQHDDRGGNRNEGGDLHPHLD